MTNMEAYNCMIDGMAVSHKDFSSDEFLYMDENMIIRDENGDEYESTWDVKTEIDRFKTDWYICKNRTAINNIIATNKKRSQGDTIPYIESKEYQDVLTIEPNDKHIIRALPMDEDGNQREFSNQDGMIIEDTIVSNIGCSKIATCKRFNKKGYNACKNCKRISSMIDIIFNIATVLLCICIVLASIMLFININIITIITAIVMILSYITMTFISNIYYKD